MKISSNFSYYDLCGFHGLIKIARGHFVYVFNFKLGLS